MKLRRRKRVRNEPRPRPGDVRKIEGTRYVLKTIRWEAGYGIYENISLDYVHEGSWTASLRVQPKPKPWGFVLRGFGRKVGGDGD